MNRTDAMAQAFQDHELDHHGIVSAERPPAECLDDVAARYDTLISNDWRAVASSQHDALVETARQRDGWQSVATTYRTIIEALAERAPRDVGLEMYERGFGHTDLATNLDAIEVNRTARHG